MFKENKDGLIGEVPINLFSFNIKQAVV